MWRHLPVMFKNVFERILHLLVFPRPFLHKNSPHAQSFCCKKIFYGICSFKSIWKWLCPAFMHFSVKVNVMWKKGLARTQIPTNRNYAPELPTFGVIAGVSYSVVQWSSLALREPPRWSWLSLVPGKYALPVSRGNLSQISSGWALLSKIQISGLAAGIVKIISSSTGRKQPL